MYPRRLTLEIDIYRYILALKHYFHQISSREIIMGTFRNTSNSMK